MRDLVVTENITLDGVIDAAGGWFRAGDADQDVDMSDVMDAIRLQREAADAGRSRSKRCAATGPNRSTTPRASATT